MKNSYLKSVVIGDYYYDPMGNITDMEESGFAYQQHYNELNQAQTHEYDLNGNLINDGQFTYDWDAESRLIRIQNHATNAVSKFVYDAYSRRVQETQIDANGQSRTTNNLWCGEILCAQANEQGQITHRYFGQGEWHNGQIYFYAQDQIGSVTAMINPQGKVAGTALFSPYGKLLQSEGEQANMAYAGLYHHQETGLYLATYRGYNPFTARWLNRDPIEENGGLNLYEYVGGKPVTKVDPLGLLCTFSQSSGSISCVDENNNSYYEKNGYAGTGEGRNNSEAQDQVGLGPLPRGDWQTVGNWYNSPNTGRNTIVLLPLPGNECENTERDCSSFRIHGNNARNDASQGCIVLPPDRTIIPSGEIIRVVR